MGSFYVTQSNPAHRQADPAQPNPIEIYKSRPNPTQWNDGQCCSQGQNPKAKDEAKARTLKAEAEAKAWTLEAKTKAWTLQGQGRGLDPRDQDQDQNSWVQ